MLNDKNYTIIMIPLKTEISSAKKNHSILIGMLIDSYYFYPI